MRTVKSLSEPKLMQAVKAPAEEPFDVGIEHEEENAALLQQED